MCGRINVADNEGVRALLESLGMDTWPTQEPRYNIAPTQTLDVVRLDGEPSLVPMTWGISLTVPGRSGMVTRRVPNSRDDKVWTSRMWKPLIENNRVLVPVNGFYEWRRENGKSKAAFYITPANAPAMFLAGLYRAAKEQGDLPEVSVITTTANEAMSEVHDRMPVILTSSNQAMGWLEETDRVSLTELMTPASNDALVFTEVSNYVNKSTHEGPQCIEPIAA